MRFNAVCMAFLTLVFVGQRIEPSYCVIESPRSKQCITVCVLSGTVRITDSLGNNVAAFHCVYGYQTFEI